LWAEEIAHRVNLAHLTHETIAAEAEEIVSHVNDVVRQVHRRAGDADNAIFSLGDDVRSLRRTLVQHRRTIPEVADEQPARVEVLPRLTKSLQECLVGGLVAEHGEHANGRAEGLAELEAPHVALAEPQALSQRGGSTLLLGLHQHLGGPFDAVYAVA